MSRHRVSLLALFLACAWATPATGESLTVIVHPERRADLDLDELVQIYLKKRRFWNDGTAVVPVNREAGSAVRSAFDRAVLGAEARRLPVYWNREYFRGVLPPATLASGAAVKRFVASEIRAIGYIRSSGVDGSVRAVLTFEAQGLEPSGSDPSARGAWPTLPLLQAIKASSVPPAFPRQVLQHTPEPRLLARTRSKEPAGISVALPETAPDRLPRHAHTD